MELNGMDDEHILRITLDVFFLIKPNLLISFSFTSSTAQGGGGSFQIGNL